MTITTHHLYVAKAIRFAISATGYYGVPRLKSGGAYPKLRSEGDDLHKLHALIAPRLFLVSGGYSDRPDRNIRYVTPLPSIVFWGAITAWQ